MFARLQMVKACRTILRAFIIQGITRRASESPPVLHQHPITLEWIDASTSVYVDDLCRTTMHDDNTTDTIKALSQDRTGIGFAANALARRMSRPRRRDWQEDDPANNSEGTHTGTCHP